MFFLYRSHSCATLSFFCAKFPSSNAVVKICCCCKRATCENVYEKFVCEKAELRCKSFGCDLNVCKTQWTIASEGDEKEREREEKRFR